MKIGDVTAHNPKVGGSNPPPATNYKNNQIKLFILSFYFTYDNILFISKPDRLDFYHDACLDRVRYLLGTRSFGMFHLLGRLHHLW